MKIETKYFGELQFDESSVLHFPDGLFGFEEEKEFLLLPFSDDADYLLCLQSAKTPHLAFTLINPFMLWAEYKPQLGAEDLRKLGLACSEDGCYYALCRVEKPVSESMVNLRCPVVINDITRQARQIILEEYEMRCKLSSLGKKADGEC